MEDDTIGYMYIDLLKNSVLRCIIDWRCLCDRITSEDKSKSDNLRGALIQFCRGQREVFLKLYLLQTFAMMQKRIDKMIESTNVYDNYITRVNDDLCRSLSKVITTDLVKPCANISAAIDLLSTGTYSRIPTMITSLVQCSLNNVIPIPPIDYNEVDLTMKRMECEYLMTFRLSNCSKLDDVSMECINSRSILSRKDLFKVTLIYDFFTWQVLDVSLDVVESYGYSKDGELKRYFLALLINKVKLLKSNVYDEIYLVSNSFCGKLIMDHLRKQCNDYKILQFIVYDYSYYTIPHTTKASHPEDNSPPEVKSVLSTLPLAESSSNSLPVNGNATPGDRGHSEDVTSSGLPGSDPRELEGEVNRRATTASGEDSDWTSGVGNKIMVDVEINSCSDIYLDERIVVLDVFVFNRFEFGDVNKLIVRFLLDEWGDVSVTLIGLDIFKERRINDYKLEYWLNKIANVLEKYQLDIINNKLSGVYMNFTNGALHLNGHHGDFALYEFNTVSVLLSIKKSITINTNKKIYTSLHENLYTFWLSHQIKCCQDNNIPLTSTVSPSNRLGASPLEVQSNSLRPANSDPTAVEASPPEVRPAVSSSNYLPVNGDATPGDRGGGGSNEDWTSGGTSSIKASSILSSKSTPKNRKSTRRNKRSLSGRTKNINSEDQENLPGGTESNPEEHEGSHITSSGLPAADLREAEGEINRRGTTPSGTELVVTSGITASGNDLDNEQLMILDSSIDRPLVSSILSSGALRESLTDNWFVVERSGIIHGVVYSDIIIDDMKYILGSIYHYDIRATDILIIINESVLNGVVILGEEYSYGLGQEIKKALKVLQEFNFIFTTLPYTHGDGILKVLNKSNLIEVDINGKLVDGKEMLLDDH